MTERITPVPPARRRETHLQIPDGLAAQIRAFCRKKPGKLFDLTD
jgi:hypothetical protein